MSKVIILQRPAKCRACGAELIAGTTASYYGRNRIYGLDCHSQDTANHANHYAELAKKTQQQANQVEAERRAILDPIPFGQPILVGHHSERRHRRMLARAEKLLFKQLELQEEANRYTRLARTMTKRQADLAAAARDRSEGVGVGDHVIARFTNNFQQYSFPGIIVGRTKNVWKVKALESPYPGEAPGRVFNIPVKGSRGYSANNCVQAQPNS